MKAKSDNQPKVRTLSVTEVSRTLSDVLDAVAAGTTVHVIRHGREVCVMAPPPPTGNRVSEILARLRGKPQVTLDDEFSKDMEIIRRIKRPARKANKWD